MPSPSDNTDRSYSHALLSLLDRPIAFHRCFAQIAGSINAGLMLSQAMYWSNRTADPDGWFFKTQHEWEAETCLTRAEQEGARKKLRATGFWQEERRGIPAKLYFRIDTERLSDALNALVIEQSSLRITSAPVCGNSANCTAQNQQSISEITAETTSEIKTPLTPHDGGITDTPISRRQKRKENTQEVLSYLNEKTGRSLKHTGFIPARLQEGHSVDDCKRVVDWLIEHKEPDWTAQYLDHTTPFRPGNFDKYLDQARRPAYTPTDMICGMPRETFRALPAREKHRLALASQQERSAS